MDGSTTTVGVIGGTGAEGKGLAARFAYAGYDVVLGSRDLTRSIAAAEELNALVGQMRVTGKLNEDAAADCDIAVLTVPYSGQRAAVEPLRDALRGKILIDATVPLIPPKVGVVQLPNGQSAVDQLQKALGEEIRVVSAFQNVSAHNLRHVDQPVACDVLVCADDPEARATVIEMLSRMRLNGIDAGPLANSIAAEALTSLLIHINRKYKVPGAGIVITGLPVHS